MKNRNGKKFYSFMYINESKFIQDTIINLDKYIKDLEIIIVDDNSSDKTVDIIKKLKTNCIIKIIERKKQRV